MRSTCDVCTGLRCFKLCHSAEFNKIVGATMLMNPSDDCTVSLWRPHRKSDFGHRKLMGRQM